MASLVPHNEPSVIAVETVNGIDQVRAVGTDAKLLLDAEGKLRWSWHGLFDEAAFTQLKSDKSVAELIGELKTTEQQIISGLDKLLAMVEERA